MKIREITADERVEAMFPLQAYAFQGSPWPDDEVEGYRRRMEYFRTTTTLVAEEGGVALAGVAALPMRQNVRGTVFDMAGVASVTAHPAVRRRGFVRQLMNELLPLMRDRGCAVGALYPFRPSFYGRFGFVGLPRVRKAAFAPEGLSHLAGISLPGVVERLSMADGFEEFDAFTRRLLPLRHGFAVHDDVRARGFREDRCWVAVAKVDDETVGAVRYTVREYGGDLVAEDLLTTGPLGRALLLQFLARHVDQVARVEVAVGTDDVPELWGTDLDVETVARADYPRERGPMARVLDLPSLGGIRAGAAAVTVEVVDDPLIGGVWRLDGRGGGLTVEAAAGGPEAALTSAGLAGLVYGVLDPVEVVTRGLGTVDDGAQEPLRTLFPREMPYVYSDF